MHQSLRGSPTLAPEYKGVFDADARRWRWATGPRVPNEELCEGVFTLTAVTQRWRLARSGAAWEREQTRRMMLEEHTRISFNVVVSIYVVKQKSFTCILYGYANNYKVNSDAAEEEESHQLITGIHKQGFHVISPKTWLSNTCIKL